MSTNHSLLSLLHISLVTLLSLLTLAVMQRIILGILALLATPVYLLLHSSTQLHNYEFTTPKKEWQRLLSDFCGTMVFLTLFRIGLIIIQTGIIKTGDFIKFFHNLQDNLSTTEAVLIHILFFTVVILSQPRKIKSNSEEIDKLESDNWFDKMREIKFPSPFDQL